VKRYAEVVIRVDTAKFQQAMRALAESARQASVAFREMSLNVQRLNPKHRHGLGNQTADGVWQTDLCASWLHDSCRMPNLCHCRCHRA
jgi:hypothetical protein